MAREVRIEDLPDELKILMPETMKRIIVIGNKAYEMYPLEEGMVEAISKDIVDVFKKIGNPDAVCPKCQKIAYEAAKRGITECQDCKEPLKSLAMHPIDAILGSGKVRDWMSIATGVSKEDASKATINQMKHFAGVFYEQNFSDDGLPRVSSENFQKLLGMMGLRLQAAK